MQQDTKKDMGQKNPTAAPMPEDTKAGATTTK